MALENTWIGYVTRSYEQIKKSLLDRLRVVVPEITDYSESHILIIIISMFAGIAEMLGLYIDNLAREAFLATARRYTSVVKLIKILDYRIKTSNPASATLQLTFIWGNLPPTQVTIPNGTQFQTTNNIIFISTEDCTIVYPNTILLVPVAQFTQINNQNVGNTSGVPSEKIAFGTNLVYNSLSLLIANEIWTLVDSFALQTPDDKIFIVDVDVDGIAYAIFGDGINGEIPPINQTYYASYRTTLGSRANVEANSITAFINNPTIIGVQSISVTNLAKATAGSDYEDIERIRTSAPLFIRTLNRAVTKQDYSDIGRLAPGVGKAKADYKCGKDVSVYVVPINGGIANKPLLDSTELFFDDKRMVTTFVDCFPAGQTRLKISGDIIARFRMDPLQVKADSIDVLVNYGKYDNQEINRKIKISDLISLLDNLIRVDYVDNFLVSFVPYARPLIDSNELAWDPLILVLPIPAFRYPLQYLPKTGTSDKWRIDYSGTNFVLYKNNLFLTTLNLEQSYQDDIISFVIHPNQQGYIAGESWEFTTYEIGKNLDIDDFTIPTVIESDIDLNIIVEQTKPI